MTPEQIARASRGDTVTLLRQPYTEKAAALFEARLLSRQFPSSRVAVVSVRTLGILILVNPPDQWKKSTYFLNGRTVT